MKREHWLGRVEYITGPECRGLLGETDHADMLIPSRTIPDCWDRRFNPWNPTHWQYWLRSRLTGRIAFLESE